MNINDDNNNNNKVTIDDGDYNILRRTILNFYHRFTDS